MNPRLNRRRHAAFWSVALSWCLTAALPANASTELPKEINQLSLKGWISPLWEPVAAVGGLLDEDGIEEVVLVLHRRAQMQGDRSRRRGSRAIAIFRLDERGDYIRVALAEELLPCVGCLGTLNHNPKASPFDIRIEDRRLSIGWISNEGELMSVRLTFAWDADYQRYVLLGDDVAYANRARRIERRRIRDYVAGTETLNGETRDIRPRIIPIEEVKAEDYQ